MLKESLPEVRQAADPSGQELPARSGWTDIILSYLHCTSKCFICLRTCSGALQIVLCDKAAI